MEHALNLKMTRAEQIRMLKDLYVQIKTYSVPWINGAITIKVITYGLSNTVNYSYQVRKGGEVIESNTSTNPDKVIERIEYFTNLGREVCALCGSEDIYSYKDFEGIEYNGCNSCEGRRIETKFEV